VMGAGRTSFIKNASFEWLLLDDLKKGGKKGKLRKRVKNWGKRNPRPTARHPSKKNGGRRGKYEKEKRSKAANQKKIFFCARPIKQKGGWGRA